jgi:hypothetical protein
MSALVLLACSCSKAETPVPMPAVKLYQGVMYQTLREHRPVDIDPDELTILIVSAEHGLLCEDDEIEPYDRRMTVERADELIAAGFPEDMYFDGPTFDRVLLAGGADYRRVMRAYVEAMRGFDQIAPDAEVIEVSGGIGDQRHQLGEFLRAAVPA